MTSNELVLKTDLQLSNELSTVVSDKFDYYFTLPYLSAQEETELAEDFRLNQSIEAAHKLVLSHMRYVVKVARSYMGYGLPMAELVQEGSIGLMKAVKKFDPAVGVRLVSFAVHWIKAEITEYVIKNWRMVKIATTKAQRKIFFNLRKMKQQLIGSGASLDAGHLANELGVTQDDLEMMEARMQSSDLELDQPVFDDDSSVTKVDSVVSLSLTPEEIIINEDIQQQLTATLPQMLAQLSQREQEIIYARFFAEDKATLKDLAQRYQVSLERVRQIEKLALEKLKTSLENKEL